MGRFCKIVLAFMLVNMVTVLCPLWARGNPSELPQVSLQPSTITVWEGETFSLNITISNLDAGFEMWGFGTGAIYLPNFPTYNISVIDLESLPQEGPFLKQFPTPPYTSEDCTLFLNLFIGPDEFDPLVSIVLLPALDPSVSNPVFPMGNGTLATLTFKAKVQGTTTIAFEGRLCGNSDPSAISYELNATIEVKRRNGDLNGDGRVDMKDIAMVSKAFGSRPSDANWMIQADMNQDSKIDLRDIALIAKNFGKTFS